MSTDANSQLQTLIAEKPWIRSEFVVMYEIADRDDYLEAFEIESNSFVRFQNEKTANKTFVELHTFLLGDEQLTADPPVELQKEHYELADLLDASIAYWMGPSVIHSQAVSNKNFTSSNNFQEKYDQQRSAEGLQKTFRLSHTVSLVFDSHIRDSSAYVQNTIKYLSLSLNNADKEEILKTYRLGHIFPEHPTLHWFKILEALRNLKVVDKYEDTKSTSQTELQAGVKFLGEYPQLFRHDKSNKYYKKSLKWLSRKFPEYLEMPQKANEYYKKNIRHLIEFYFDNY